MSGIAEQLLFNRWKELDGKTWNKDPFDKRYKPIFSEMEAIEQELRTVHKLEITWTMTKEYRLEAASKAEPVKLELKKRTPPTRYTNRYSQKKKRDDNGVPYWIVIDKSLKEADRGPIYNENAVATLVEKLNKAERAKATKRKAKAVA